MRLVQSVQSLDAFGFAVQIDLIHYLRLHAGSKFEIRDGAPQIPLDQEIVVGDVG